MPALVVGNKEIDCELIVFDKDGTLLDQYPLLLGRARARRKAIRQCGSEEAARLWERIVGVDLKTGKIDEEGPLATLPRKEEVLVAALSFYLTGDSWDTARQLIQKAYQSAENSLAPPFGSVLFPKVRETLTRLKRRGFRLAVASTDKHSLIEQSFRALRIDSLFDTVVGADDVAKGKPSADMLNEVMRQIGERCRETVIVGDSASDMQMGRNAKLKACIGVLTGSGKREILEELADAVVDSVADLKAR